MLKTGIKYFVALILVFSLYNCIDYYVPDLHGYGSLLVVDGLITNENASYTIKLSRTLNNQNGIPEMEPYAKVYIEDDAGIFFQLKNKGNGIYKTDSTEFIGSVGHSYVLHINTEDGEIYESERAMMFDVQEIDSIYFEKDEIVVNNGTESYEGIRIYLDSDGGEIDDYYRWEFVETWKYKVPMPVRSIYIDENTILVNADVKEHCWRFKKSDEILIHAGYMGLNGKVQKEPLFFIAPEKSDRLSMQYSMLVKQYSISKKEFDFWDNLKKINDSGGDIFAAQPYPVKSNINNIKNQQERVLGYFQVSAVNQKRMNIPFKDVVGLDLPFYQYPCVRVEFSPRDNPWNKFNPPLTWDDVYYMFTTSGYYFVEPKYYEGTFTIDRLVFTKPECADCELTGTMEKPDFWEDIN